MNNGSVSQSTPTMVPPFDSPDILGLFEWHAGDVVVSAGEKQGTTWMMNIVHQLRTGGDEEFSNIHEECLWFERSEHPGQSAQERIARWAENGFGRHSFRVFKTHVTPPTLPFRSDVKYIVPVRNSKDASISLHNFHMNFSEDMKNAWQWDIPFSTLPDFILNHYLKSRVYYSFVNAWFPHRHEDNVLMLHYADLKRDFEGTFRQVADFLGTEVSDRAFPDIAEKCGFSWMKANSEKFDYVSATSGIRDVNRGAAVRKGIIGEHRSHFTPELESVWNETHMQEIPDNALRNWCDNGGVLPI